MFDGVLHELREKIRARLYVVTAHARLEMLDDNLLTVDLEQAVITGSIVERQDDHRTAELKYRVRGAAADGRTVEVIAKQGPTGKVVFVTVYAL